MQLRDQLNFYFGDSNLVKDNFLRQKLTENTQVPLTLFQSFNRVKTIFGEEKDDSVQSDLMQQAVRKSNMLKLSKCGKLLKRRLPFDLKRVDLASMDKNTVYVENFPDSLLLQDIAKIFSRAGEIRNITLPKFQRAAKSQNDEAMVDTDESESLLKGFCFIEFSSQEGALKAIETFNNCIPEELTNAEHKNYVRVEGNLGQLNVMSKE